MPIVEPLLACRGAHDAFDGDAIDASRGRFVGLCENRAVMKETTDCHHYAEDWTMRMILRRSADVATIRLAYAGPWLQSQGNRPHIGRTKRLPKRSRGESEMALAMRTTRRLLGCLLLASGPLALPAQSEAETTFKAISTQYIAALGDPGASAGIGAEAWGLWRLDPGPRGVRLTSYEALKADGGVAPALWKFDGSDWWLEEHGLIMEQPEFPIPPGKYVVTGGRETTAVLTVHAKGDDGVQHWELDNGATLYDVTHLRCRSARYTPEAGGDSCSPAKAQMSAFPVAPGGAMPPVEGCNKQDYDVLIVIGIVADH